MLDVGKIRKDFPILRRLIAGKPLVYLDNAATTQKPQVVIDAIVDYYTRYNANIHRGIHTLAVEATQSYEEARKKVGRFINAKSEKEIIFTRGTTEAINLVAYSWGRLNVEKGDEIVLTVAEHHSNLVPWQQLALENGATLKYLDIDEQGYLDIKILGETITKKTKLVAVTHVSNVLGTINPIKEIVRVAHQKGALVLVDGAQAVPHIKVDVQDLGCDFYAFSSHKMLGPTGIGVLWGRKEVLEVLPSFQFGGDMIREVYLDRTVFAELPHKFEAGTPDIAGAIGLGAAIDYLNKVGMENVRTHEKKLVGYGLAQMTKIPGLTIYGPMTTRDHSGVIAFNVSGIHPHDLAQILDGEGVAIRSGHHCAMPLHARLGISASARASFYIYNTCQEIDKLVEGIKKAKRIFKV
ncbi:MAG: cysteine desulfurase/selenocysteine lyase [Microgenomates group bacterium LiPW_16]|nr:MAG: cysteine desulfurase/selenocysteine lyase [Microgenomates group bacterium LiPW_16]